MTRSKTIIAIGMLLSIFLIFVHVYYVEVILAQYFEPIQFELHSRINMLQLQNRKLEKEVIELKIINMVTPHHGKYTQQKTIAIAHRGNSNIAPENTLSSVQEAINIGVTMVEVDIQISKDKIPIVIHDRKIDRTTNGTGDVQNMTVSELKKFDAGSWKNHKYKHERIPTLEEVWRLCSQNNVLLYLDLKTNQNGEAISKVIRTAKLDTAILFLAVTSIIQIQDIYEYTKNMNIVWYGDIPYSPDQAFINRMKRFGITVLEFRKENVTKEWVDACHENDLHAWCFTVNDKDEMKKMIDLGIDAIETDFPQGLVELIKEK